MKISLQSYLVAKIQDLPLVPPFLTSINHHSIVILNIFIYSARITKGKRLRRAFVFPGPQLVFPSPSHQFVFPNTDHQFVFPAPASNLHFPH